MRANRTIGDTDDLETVFSSRVSRIGIGVMLAGQFLVAQLERVDRYRPVEGECAQVVTQGGRGRVAGLLVALFCCLCPFGSCRRENVERVENLFLVEMLPAACAEFPGRALPGDIGPELGFNLAGRHAFIEIPARIVLTDMLQAEPEILP